MYTTEQLKESISNCKASNLCFLITISDDFQNILPELVKYKFKSEPMVYMGIGYCQITITLNEGLTNE